MVRFGKLFCWHIKRFRFFWTVSDGCRGISQKIYIKNDNKRLCITIQQSINITLCRISFSVNNIYPANVTSLLYIILFEDSKCTGQKNCARFVS
jgi:hypothetical protein